MGAVTTITNALKAIMPTFGTTNADIESKIIDVVGTLADSEAMERNNTLNVINEALANQKITTVEYYRRKAVAFQYGDSLVYDPINQGGYYDTIDTEKQIIKQAYVVGAYPIWTLLANALGTNGHLRKLTADELSSLQTYFKAFQPMGLELNVTSMDVAKITTRVLSSMCRQVRTHSTPQTKSRQTCSRTKRRCVRPIPLRLPRSWM